MTNYPHKSVDNYKGGCKRRSDAVMAATDELQQQFTRSPRKYLELSFKKLAKGVSGHVGRVLFFIIICLKF